VTAIRLIPVAPFSLVNLMAGACSIALFDYVAGTLLGMIPGLIVLSVLGNQVTAIFTDFTVKKFVVLLLFVMMDIVDGIATSQSM
jgi:phospholipase D1/2